MKYLMIAVFALGYLFNSGTALAQPVGHDNPAFQRAVKAWLDDDDQTALPALATLAAEDNRAAQVLLGRIATRPMGPWLAGLERKERNALLRAPGGLSGTSWLKVAMETGDYTAWLFIQAEDPRAGAKMVRALMDAGEDNAAGVLVARLSLKRDLDEGTELYKMMHERKTPTDANYLIGRMIPPNIVELTPDLDGISRSGPILDEIMGFPFFMLIALNKHSNIWQKFNFRLRRQLFNGIAPPVADTELIKAGADDEQPVALPKPMEALWSACTRVCGNTDLTRNMCVMRSMNLVDGFEGLRRLGSPVEGVIPHDTFKASKRAVADIGNQARLLMGAYPDVFREAHVAVNGCANDLLSLN